MLPMGRVLPYVIFGKTANLWTHTIQPKHPYYSRETREKSSLNPAAVPRDRRELALNPCVAVIVYHQRFVTLRLHDYFLTFGAIRDAQSCTYFVAAQQLHATQGFHAVGWAYVQNHRVNVIAYVIPDYCRFFDAHIPYPSTHAYLLSIPPHNTSARGR